jgi:hypothetical protein
MNGTGGSQRISVRKNGLKDSFAQWAKENFPKIGVAAVSHVIGLDWGKVKRFETLMACSKKIQTAVFAGRLHIENVPFFEKWSAKDQNAFFSFFKGLKLSFQTEREFLEWLPEIAYAGNSSIASLLESDEITGAKNNARLGAPQRIEKIRACIFALRFPGYDAALKKWKHLSQKAFGGLSNVVVTPSPYFEKKRIEVRITISRANEARASLEKMSAIPESVWSSLIDPTRSWQEKQ